MSEDCHWPEDVPASIMDPDNEVRAKYGIDYIPRGTKLYDAILEIGRQERERGHAAGMCKAMGIAANICTCADYWKPYGKLDPNCQGCHAAGEIEAWMEDPGEPVKDATSMDGDGTQC